MYEQKQNISQSRNKKSGEVMDACRMTDVCVVFSVVKHGALDYF